MVVGKRAELEPKCQVEPRPLIADLGRIDDTRPQNLDSRDETATPSG